MDIKSLIKLLRPHQYIKNIFVFLPLFFALKITDKVLLFNCFISFVSFSMVASCVYIFNDYNDIEEDKKHPNKKFRPLASGKITTKIAFISFAILLIFGLSISFLLNIKVMYLLLFYFLLNIAYTIKLKHLPIIDVFVVAIGFVIRVFVGSKASNIELSLWIVLMTFLLALFLGLAKRRDDVALYFLGVGKTRKVIDGYNFEFLNASMIMMASVTVVSYIMYTVSSEVEKKMNSNNLYFTVFWVLLGIMRYLQITMVENKSGSPTEILLKDKIIQGAIILWIFTFSLLIYFK